MTNKLDYYIYAPNFIGPALVVFGVPGAPPLAWNDAHNGWDIAIPAETQVLYTSTPASDASIYASHHMLREDGSWLELP